MSSNVTMQGDRAILQGRPARPILEDPGCPPEVVEVVEEFDAAVGVFAAAYRERDRVERESRAASTRTAKADKDAEALAASAGERSEEKAALRAVQAAGRKAAAVLEASRRDVRAISARIDLEAHAVQVDALVDAYRAGADKVGTRVPPHPMIAEHDRHDTVAETSRGLSALERADRVNTPALVALAGDPCGLVPVQGSRPGVTHGPIIWTVERRARMLEDARGQVHGWEWSRVPVEEALEATAVPA